VDEKRIESGIRSLLVLPLSYQGGIIGAMDMGSPTPDDIGPADAWLAENIMPLLKFISMLNAD
jgi:putative methionine-R-sulfoxide reductase with GAF domain